MHRAAEKALRGEMAIAPYPGQGFPISKRAGYLGEWIYAGRYFLCVHALVRGAADVRSPTGAVAVGFSVDILAEKFGVSPIELMDANRRGELLIEEVRTSRGEIGDRLIGLYCRDRSIAVDIEEIRAPVSSFPKPSGRSTRVGR